MSRRNNSDGSLFVGRLSKNCRVRDLEDVFEPYGRMARCEIKYGMCYTSLGKFPDYYTLFIRAESGHVRPDSLSSTVGICSP